MAQATQPYKRSLSGSIGSGMKSVLGGNDRRFYVLEHKVSSQYHKAGESQRIIVDQIEIGRGHECQVRFDESFTTVSRRHAAIVKDGDNWKLVQLSQTNSTYLNGRRVEKEWYLQSGDEIQLSTNGPKLGFIVPQGDKGLVKSIGLTARMNLFRQQALRPYKIALIVLSILFVLAVGGLIAYNVYQNKIHQEEMAVMQEQVDMTKQEVVQTQQALDQVGHRGDHVLFELAADFGGVGSSQGSGHGGGCHHQAGAELRIEFFQFVHFSLLLFVVVFFGVQCFQGPFPFSQRKKETQNSALRNMFLCDRNKMFRYPGISSLRHFST